MKREQVREAYQQRSTTASTVCRQLAFAGIAIVWLFRTNPKGPATTAQLDPDFIWAGLLLVIGLTLDILQYIYASAAWGILNRVLERRGLPRDHEFMVHPAINWPTLWCYWGKLVLVATAYIMILIELLAKFFPG